jgi:hypothetical protein
LKFDRNSKLCRGMKSSVRQNALKMRRKQKAK